MALPIPRDAPVTSATFPASDSSIAGPYQGVGSVGWPGEPPRRGDQPLPPTARRQPRRLAPLGGGGLRRGAGARRAGAGVDRLLGLPLVPRDGPRVLRGRRGGGRDEPGLRQREG